MGCCQASWVISKRAIHQPQKAYAIYPGWYRIAIAIAIAPRAHCRDLQDLYTDGASILPTICPAMKDRIVYCLVLLWASTLERVGECLQVCLDKAYHGMATVVRVFPRVRYPLPRSPCGVTICFLESLGNAFSVPFFQFTHAAPGAAHGGTSCIVQYLPPATYPAPTQLCSSALWVSKNMWPRRPRRRM